MWSSRTLHQLAASLRGAAMEIGSILDDFARVRIPVLNDLIAAVRPELAVIDRLAADLQVADGAATLEERQAFLETLFRFPDEVHTSYIVEKVQFACNPHVTKAHLAGALDTVNRQHFVALTESAS